MNRERTGKSPAGVRVCAAALAAAFLASGCSSSSLVGTSQPPPPPETAAAPDAPKPSSFRERMTALFAGRSAPQPAPVGVAAAQPVASNDCPSVDVRSGASTYTLGPPGAEATA